MRRTSLCFLLPLAIGMLSLTACDSYEAPAPTMPQTAMALPLEAPPDTDRQPSPLSAPTPPNSMEAEAFTPSVLLPEAAPIDQEPEPIPPPSAEPPSDVTKTTEHATPSPPPPEPVGSAGYRLEIPALGLSYPVYADIANEDLAAGPGWYPYTAPPGEGNTAIAGHRTFNGAPSFFYELDRLQPGDEIHLVFSDRQMTYEVSESWITSPYDLGVLAPTPSPSLTLTTCDPIGSEEHRLIVRATLRSKP